MTSSFTYIESIGLERWSVWYLITKEVWFRKSFMMMEEDEEVLFDQAGLLTNRVKPVPDVRIQVTGSRVFKTFCLCAAFFGLVRRSWYYKKKESDLRTVTSLLQTFLKFLLCHAYSVYKLAYINVPCIKLNGYIQSGKKCAFHIFSCVVNIQYRYIISYCSISTETGWSSDVKPILHHQTSLIRLVWLD